MKTTATEKITVETEKDTLEIQVKYFNGQQPLVIRKEGNWIDLRSNEDIFIPKNTQMEIHLGIGMILPEGYEAYIVPRSSTFKNYGLIQTNHMGVIDTSYCGDNDEWKMSVYCLVPKTMEKGIAGTYVKKGDRICQFRIMKSQPTIKFQPVEHLKDKDRGGFGSTGTA